MEYEKIILEMLSRIKVLEEEIAVLKGCNDAPCKNQTSTADIKLYIKEKKTEAKNNGEEVLIIKANDLHKELKLKSRMPAVCNAMKQAMEINDVVLHETPSGFSSTYTVEYKL